MINQTNILIDVTEEVKKLHVPPLGGRITEEDYYNLKAELEAAKKREAKLREGIKKTLKEHSHLADGDVCTLIDLKKALQKTEDK